MRKLLVKRYSTGADIESVCKELGMHATAMAAELGIHPVTLYEYIAGRATPKRSIFLALECVRAGYLARRACIEAGTEVLPALEIVT